jgi:hypothetical protein
LSQFYSRLTEYANYKNEFLGASSADGTPDRTTYRTKDAAVQPNTNETSVLRLAAQAS